MEKSESIKEIAKAISVFHLKVDKIKKDATNPFFKNRYASLSNILEAIDQPLREAGITFVQFPEGENGLSTMIMHGESGEWIQSSYFMTPAKNDPQGSGSAITYMRRYAISSILGLNIEDDDDANTATHGGKTPEQAEENQKPWLNDNTPQYKALVKRLIDGSATIEQAQTHYKISKTMREKLIAVVNEANLVKQ